jgi:two-component system response regulator AtoC
VSPVTHSTGVLIIDDDPGIHRCLSTVLAPAYSVHLASSGEEGLRECERLHPDVVLLDVMLPQMSGIAVLRALKRTRAELPVIMMTAYAEVQTAIQAIKLGAVDYLQKPIDPEAVLREIAHATQGAPPRTEPARTKIVGQSAQMKRIWKLVECFGPTDIPILLQGETGTGKGLFAEAIHQLSKRAQGPLIPIDCATIPADLAESELFGYEDGAFTGAGRKKRGRVAFADGGTLFLDEIGTLAVATQAKLLMLIEQQNFLPLGARSVQPTHLDVRFVSATNVPLQRAVDEGSFRADLFHRLNGVTIEIPPLRERRGDIELLARHFVAQFGIRQRKPDLESSAEALQVLQEYPWPGNVRELERVISATVVLANTAITVNDLPEHIRAAGHWSPAPPPLAERTGQPAGDRDGVCINLREVKESAGREAQKRIILELQKRTNISQQELARILGVDPKTLRARLKEISNVDPTK